MTNNEISEKNYTKKTILKINYIKLFYAIIICAIVVFCALAFIPILNATFIAVIVCCLSTPLLNFFERKQLNKMVAIIIVFVIILAIIFLLGLAVKHIIPSDPMQALTSIQTKITNGYASVKTNFIDKSPDFLKKFFTDDVVDRIVGFFSSMFSIDSLKNILTNSTDASGNGVVKIFTQIFGYSSSVIKFVSSMTNFFSVLFVAAVMLFFLMWKGREIEKSIMMIVPNKYFEMVVTTWREISLTFSKYLTGTLEESLVIGFLTSLGWYICGVELVPAIIGGCIVGLLNAIPYVGPFFGWVVGVIMSQFGLINTSHYLIKGVTPGFINMSVVIIIVQTLDQFLKPSILSHSVQLPGLVVFLGFIAGGKLFGFVGMVFAVPIIAIFKIIGTTFYKQLRDYKCLDEKTFVIETRYQKKD